jgi:hypothetical protein
MGSVLNNVIHILRSGQSSFTQGKVVKSWIELSFNDVDLRKKKWRKKPGKGAAKNS